MKMPRIDEHFERLLFSTHTSPYDDGHPITRELRKRYRFQRCNRNDPQFAVQHALVETALNKDCINSRAYRYILEALFILYKDLTSDKGQLKEQFCSIPEFSKYVYATLQHFKAHPVRNEQELVTKPEHVKLWIKLFELSLPRLQHMCRLANIRDTRLLTLGDCVKLQVDMPDFLQSCQMIRCVQAFSLRVLHTPAGPYTSTNTSPLVQAANTHVNGCSERSNKVFSNGSQMLSATSDVRRAVQYALFYGQVTPFLFCVDIKPDDVVPTTWVLGEGEGTAHHLALKISSSHKEFMPRAVTHFPDDSINRLFCLYLDQTGKLNKVSDTLDTFSEYWVHTAGIHTRPDLVQEIENMELRSPSSVADVSSLSKRPLVAKKNNRSTKRRRITREDVEVIDLS